MSCVLSRISNESLEITEVFGGKDDHACTHAHVCVCVCVRARVCVCVCGPKLTAKCNGVVWGESML